MQMIWYLGSTTKIDPKVLTPGLVSPAIPEVSLKARSTLPYDSEPNLEGSTSPWLQGGRGWGQSGSGGLTLL